MGAIAQVDDALAQVVPSSEGTSTVVDAAGDTLDISGGQLSRDSSNLFHSFEQFDLNAEQTANFVTNARIQNIVGSIRGGAASTIDGSIQVSGSNANLYLMNPAGILFGPNAKLNLSGGITATTANRIDFAGEQLTANESANYSELVGMPTAFQFTQERAGAVVNLGDLKVEAGQSISLIGGTVVNTGSLEAPDGTVTIAAVEGENLVRLSQEKQLLSLEVAAVASSASSSVGAFSASISELLTGGELSGATALLIDVDGTVRLASTDTAISEAGGSAIASGTVSTAGETGGNINVLGDQVSLQAATIDASGTREGGLVRIGGDYQGNGSVVNANYTSVDSSSRIMADALAAGDGGRVILWSDDALDFYGSITARGGNSGGNGGFAELSGKKRLAASGSVDLSAPQGDIGTVLLDPENIVITDGSAPTSTATTTYLSSSYVEALSNTANVNLTATNDFIIEDLSDNRLLFQPDRSVTFTADSDGDLQGEFIMLGLDDWIDADGGNISIFGAGVTAGTITTDTSSGAGKRDGGNVTISSSQGVSVEDVSTNAYANGNNAGNGGQVRIEAANGDITVRNPIKTWSHSDEGNNAGNGGGIELLASDSIRVGTLNSASVAGKNSAGSGGQILLRAGAGDVAVTGDIISESRAGKNNAQAGGGITVEAANNVDVAGIINTSSTADNLNTDSAGTVALKAGSGIAVRDIAAVSTGRGSNGNIFLTGDRIDLLGGSESVSGQSIQFSPASKNQDINIGISVATGSTLDVSQIDLAAIAAAENIDIGRADSTGAVSLFSENIEFVNEKFPIRILGGTTLIGPDIDSDWAIDGLNRGSVNGFLFENISNLQGGDRNDTFKFEADGNLSGSVAGGTGAGIDTVDFTNSAIATIDATFSEIEDFISRSPTEETEETTEETEETTEETEETTEETEETTEETEETTEETTGSRSPVEPEPSIEPTDPKPPVEPEFSESAEEKNTTETITPVSLAQTAESNSQTWRSAIASADQASESTSSRASLSYITQDRANEAEATASVFSQVEAGIGQSFRGYLGLSDSDSQPETVDSVQKRLRDVERETGITPALIYAYFVPDAKSQSAIITGSDRLAQLDDQLEIMLITPGSDPIRQRQWGITREQVAATGQNLRQQATSQFSTARQYLEPAQQLYNWLIKPIERDLIAQSVESLGFVMDDGLRTLPIAALHNGDRYLVEDYSVGLLPSFSLTEFERTGANRTDFSRTQVLAMGASEFQNQPALPAVDAEIALITQQLWQGDAFLNEDFVLENLKNQIKQKEYGIIHLATHASFEAGNLENSYIQMWDDKLSLNNVKELGLNNSDISLIILSACNTALGDRTSEYGFAGFAVTAGSPSALASLWPVSDEGTLGFMSQFYKELKQSSVRAEALQQAQVSLIRGNVGISDGLIYGPNDNEIAQLPDLAESGRWDFSHPFYWSAFTMIGNPW